MRTRRFLFVALGFSALMLRLGFADEPAKAPAQNDDQHKTTISVRRGEPPHVTGDRTDRKNILLNGIGRDSNWGSQLRSVPGLTKSTTANGFRPPVFKKMATAANQPLLVNKPVTYSAPLVKLPAERAIAGPFSRALPGRVPTAVALGGLTAPTAKNSAAALNGTAMKRKP